jgi:PAS domain-containing protein
MILPSADGADLLSPRLHEVVEGLGVIPPAVPSVTISQLEETYWGRFVVDLQQVEVEVLARLLRRTFRHHRILAGMLQDGVIAVAVVDLQAEVQIADEDKVSVRLLRRIFRYRLLVDLLRDVVIEVDVEDEVIAGAVVAVEVMHYDFEVILSSASIEAIWSGDHS